MTMSDNVKYVLKSVGFVRTELGWQATYSVDKNSSVFGNGWSPGSALDDLLHNYFKYLDFANLNEYLNGGKK